MAKIKVYDNSKNYTGIIVEIQNLTNLEKLDNLVGTNIFGSQILVSKETAIGDLGVYFPSETQLSHKFLAENNLYRHSNLNKDQAKTGFFDDNRRCKAIKFKGHVSTGFFIPIESLKFFTTETLKVGTEFNEINGTEICRKYFKKVPGFGSNQPKKLKITDLVDARCMPEHIDTDNLFRNIHKLELNDTISVTRKIHGTSLRVSNNIVYRSFNWWQKLISKVVDLKDHDYKYIAASRRVIKSIDFEALEGKQHFYPNDIWTRATKLFENKLHKGENIYAEIVGWDGEVQIQPGYTYGFPQGEFKVFVYRISRTNPDGVMQDLTWPQLKERCSELGVSHVPEIFYGTVQQFLMTFCEQEDKMQELLNRIKNTWNWRAELEEQVKMNFLDKPSIFNSKEWQGVEEGIVIQKERLGIVNAFKAKSPLFLLVESKQADSGETNIEDQESYIEEESNLSDIDAA